MCFCTENCDIEGALRLIGGSNITQGRVEVCYNGIYGSVCDENWGASDAAVVCRQLGYRTDGQLDHTILTITSSQSTHRSNGSLQR